MGRRGLSQKGRNFWEERNNSRRAKFTVPSVVYKQPLVCSPKFSCCYLWLQCHTYTLDLNSFTWSATPQRLYMWGYLKKQQQKTKKISVLLCDLCMQICVAVNDRVCTCVRLSLSHKPAEAWPGGLHSGLQLPQPPFCSPCLWREKLTTGQAGKL